MEVFTNEEQTYFDLLPNEILLKIFERMKTDGLIILCQTYPKLLHFCEDKLLMKVLDLSRANLLGTTPDFMKIVSNKLIAEYITVFNINYIYWIPAAEIRRTLKKMINLEELHILGTKMRLNQADCDCYDKLKLKKIAIQIQESDLSISNIRHFEDIEYLYVQITRRARAFRGKFNFFVRNLKNLKELWIEDIEKNEGKIIPLPGCVFFHMDEFKKYVFKGSCHSIHQLHCALRYSKKIFWSDLHGLNVYLESNRNSYTQTMAYSPIHTSPSWGRLLESIVPYGLSDAKKLALGEQVTDIFFEELNLKHGKRIEHETVADKRNVIFSNNTRFVKKLSLDTCLLEDRPEEKVGSLENSQNIKEIELKFKYYMENVNELELCICDGHEDLKLYYMPQHLKKLTHLYLEIPKAIDGLFFKAIMENCELLHTLNIYIPRSNESFCHGFYRFIHLAKHLRNLRFSHYWIPLDRLFFALSSIKQPKMEKLYLACNNLTINDFKLANMKKFLTSNPNLNIMAIASATLPEKTAKLLKDETRPFMNSPEKVFLVDKSEGNYDYPFGLSDFCKFQLSPGDSFVATINVSEEFSKKIQIQS